MKYGEHLEQESVPQWSLHNLDYNTLKHEIKVHTTRAQATALTIPGQENTALARFEDALYNELVRQHDRVHLFVTSKADEVLRRLAALETSIQRQLAKAREVDQNEPDHARATLRRQRRLAKYERELMRCGDDVQALSRFANAQVVAFRKIVKKYKKWTGSPHLGARFNENVLKDPKSFTRRDFSHLRQRYEDLLTTLRQTYPDFSEPSSPCSLDGSHADDAASHPLRGDATAHFEPLPPPHHETQMRYWNEYDNGSENGGPEDEYAIYINPDEHYSFPGLGYIHGLMSLPFETVKQWFRPSRPSDGQRPLLPDNNRHGSNYATFAPSVTDSDEEGYASSSDLPTQGYATLYAFPSISDQKVIRYRENALFWGTIGCFISSFALLGIASILITTGRHKLRVEVDAGVAVGVMISLFCACSGLGMTFYRRDPLPIPYVLMVWSAFFASCILNAMLLLLVVGNSP